MIPVRDSEPESDNIRNMVGTFLVLTTSRARPQMFAFYL